MDFELELIHRDEINVAYILQLLAKLKGGTPGEQAQQRKAIMDLLTSEIQLRSKKELIEKFIEENLPVISEVKDIPEAFATYVEEEKQMAFKTICAEEKLYPEKLNEVLRNYLFTERSPMPDEIVGLLKEKPKLLERKNIFERISEKIKDFIETYITGVSPHVYDDDDDNSVRVLKNYEVNEDLTLAAEE